MRISPSTLINTGDVAVEGLIISFQTTQVVNDIAFDLGFFQLDPRNIPGASVAGLPGTNFTVTLPSGTATGQVLIAPGESWTSPATQVLTFATADESTLQVTAQAANGGTPFQSDMVTV